MECSHALLEFKTQMKTLDKLLIYDVTEQTNNQLPIAFKALSCPTIMLYPGNR